MHRIKCNAGLTGPLVQFKPLAGADLMVCAVLRAEVTMLERVERGA